MASMPRRSTEEICNRSQPAFRTANSSRLGTEGGAHGRAVGFGGHSADALVGAQAQGFGGNVFGRNADVEAEVKSGAQLGRGGLALLGGDGAFHHLAVEIEAGGAGG